MSSASLTPSIFDVNGLSALKRQAKANDPAALKAAAQQFEALFLQMVLKSMRDATPREGLFDSDQTRLYESLLDQQMAQVLAGKGSSGLAALIEKQLTRGADGDPESFENGLPVTQPASAFPLGRKTEPMPLPAISAVPAATVSSTTTPTVRDYVARIWPHAVDAGRATGIPAAFLVAQSALESGWGRSELRRADGQPSYNVFGIKAGRNWSGAAVDANTTEYVNGIAQQKIERFRAYGSYAEAFRDYASLLGSSSRYADVLGKTDAAGFAQALQRAGYATDPAYAEKLTRILSTPVLQGALAA